MSGTSYQGVVPAPARWSVIQRTLAISTSAVPLVASEIVPMRPALAGLQSDWNRLFRSGRFEPCLSYEWSSALVANQLDAHDDLWLVLLRRAERLIGIVPMMRSRHLVSSVPVYTVRPICEHGDAHSDLLIEGHDEDAIEAFLRAVQAIAPPWHEFRLSRILADHPLARRIESALRRQNRAFRIAHFPPSFFLDLPADFASYLQQRSGKFRNHLRRMQKRLADLGRIELRVCKSGAGVDVMYDAMLEVETHSWKHQYGTSIAGRPQQSGFYRDLCATAGSSGMLHLSVLFLDERPIAHNLGLVDGRRYHYLKTSYVEDMKRYGPATVARAALVRTLIEDGITEIDFPGAPFEWERQWTNGLRHHRAISMYNTSPSSRLLFGLQSFKHWLGSGQGTGLQYAESRPG